MNPLRARAEAVTLGTLAALVTALPAGGARRLGHALGELWFRLDAGHREVARRNLEMALPGRSAGERREIARAAFRHFGAVLVDLLRFPSYDAEEVAARVRIDGWENLENALARGKGALLFTAHYGHWELAGLAQGFRGRPLDVVTRPLDNEWLERRLARARRRSGNRVIHKRAAIRGILRALREGRSVALVIDQNFRDAGRVFVDFFGRPAATTPTLGVLAVRTGAPVLPVFSWPEADGRYRIEYRPEVLPVDTEDRAADALDLTRRCTGLIEAQIRARPEYWLWMHQRWRTRPETAGGSRAGGEVFA
ncbi:MAG: lysophospholipid acyltransferase family protein [Acidobacteriota bacterium]